MIPKNLMLQILHFAFGSVQDDKIGSVQDDKIGSVQDDAGRRIELRTS